MKRVFYYIIIFLSLLYSGNAAAQDDCSADSMTASLLTCSPGQAIYEYYGHTALLIRNITKGKDAVFNYGLFSYNTPHFAWRFVRGDTDYQVGADELYSFLSSYAERGSFVRELSLNLTQRETHRLFLSLLENCQPENCTYHYDLFYDNCATRVRDQIEHCIEGRLVFTNKAKKQSLRDIVHEYSAPYPWSTFGQDLLLGAESDREATQKIQQFAPLYLERDLSTARIRQADGRIRPLVSNVQKLVTEHAVPSKKEFPLTPLACSLILLAVTLFVSVQDYRRKKTTWIYDLLLFAAQGLTGCVIAFMLFFSQHPTVDSNWLIILFNPLPLVFLYPAMQAERRARRSRIHLAAGIILLAFILLSPVMPQYFGATTIVLALCLLLRNVCCYLTGTKRPQKEFS